MIPQETYCFTAEADSILYVIGTTATTCIIVNNTQYIIYLAPTSDNIKWLGGNNVQITGTLCILVKSDYNSVAIIPNLDVVYVPSSPYNLIPPQILICQIKQQGFHIKYFHHNKLQYILKYIKSTITSSYRLTIPMKNSLFHLQTNEGYTTPCSPVSPIIYANFENLLAPHTSLTMMNPLILQIHHLLHLRHYHRKNT